MIAKKEENLMKNLNPTGKNIRQMMKKDIRPGLLLTLDAMKKRALLLIWEAIS